MLAIPPSSAPIPLDYAAAPSPWRKRGRRILIALILAMTAFCGWRWGPYGWHQAQVLYWQRECLNFSASADTVVYEEDPVAAAALLGGADYFPYGLKRGGNGGANVPVVRAAAFEPVCWRKMAAIASLPVGSTLFASNGGGAGSGAVIFLHERTSPAGHIRLVCISYAPDTNTFQPAFIEDYDYDASVVLPGTLFKPPTIPLHLSAIDVLSGYPRRPPLVRVYAGQPDPNDPGHFTIRYQIWGQEDTLDGRLGDDDQITLTPRHLPDWPRN